MDSIIQQFPNYLTIFKIQMISYQKKIKLLLYSPVIKSRVNLKHMIDAGL